MRILLENQKMNYTTPFYTSPKTKMPTPMFRHEMRGLKAKKHEEKHLQNIKQTVIQIYETAIDVAESLGHTSYNFCIDPVYANVDYSFYRNNMEEILSQLQALFPDCYVTHTMMTTGKDGKMYDISKMESAARQFLTESKECIVIDWS